MTDQALSQHWYISYLSRSVPFALAFMALFSGSKVYAQEVDTTLDQWKKWEGNTDKLCLAKPLYCGCGGYYEEPQPSSELQNMADEQPKSSTFFGVADEYSYSLDGVAEMLGNVAIQIEELQVNAQKMALNNEEQSAAFTGDVQLSLPGFQLSGPSAVVSTVDEKATIDQAGLIFYQSGLRGYADQVEINGDTGLIIREGELTSCTPGNESWMLVGKEIDLNVDEGWGTIHHMRIEVSDIPVFYVPYFTFPLDDRRQSGFLVPQIDFAEPDIAIPYYINLAPNYDLTLTPRFIGNRGSMIESEFRYLSKSFNGQLNLDSLPSDERRKAANLDADRAKIEWNHNGELSDRWDYDIDFNYVSDPDYFTDFGNSLNSQTELFLDRTLNIRYISPKWSFFTRFQDYQVLDTELDTLDYPYRRVPEMQLNHFDRLTQNLPIFWDNKFSYTYFEQPRALIPSAHRMTWNSTLNAPFTFFWGQMEPKVELNHRIYSFGESGAPDETYKYTIPSVSLDTRFALRRNNIKDRYWQTLEPRIFMTHTPYKDQSEIPLFDTSELTLDYDQLFLSNPYIGGDRIADRQQVSFGLTSRLFEEDTGRMVLRGDIGQGFVKGDHTPIITRLVFSPQDRLYWTNQINWQDNNNGLYSASSRINYVRPRETYGSTDAISFEYRYRQDDDTLEGINQYEVSMAHTLNHKLKLLGKVRYDNREDRSFEHIVGFTYTDCCWQASLVYHRLLETDEISSNDLTAETGILFEITLKNLGGLGGGLKSFIQEQIPGFEPKSQF
ncbi:MAG: LPS assembly protein LptD [Pseudomonadota bacterium]|nr:LPS assembly protein LptD [Pseudomonadota bacterium]